MVKNKMHLNILHSIAFLSIGDYFYFSIIIGHVLDWNRYENVPEVTSIDITYDMNDFCIINICKVVSEI